MGKEEPAESERKGWRGSDSSSDDKAKQSPFCVLTLAQRSHVLLVVALALALAVALALALAVGRADGWLAEWLTAERARLGL